IFKYNSSTDLGIPQGIEKGIENLKTKMDTEDLRDLIIKKGCDTQLGGSALLTIRTIASLKENFKTAYVGCYGNATDIETKAGFSSDIRSEFGFIDDRSWLFESKTPPGRAVIKLRRGKRLSIDIDPGANNDLKEHIEKKNKSDGSSSSSSSFIDFLLNSKWIHLSSLADVNQFEFIMASVLIAKKMNPLIKLSIDPGYEYTKYHRKMLTKYLPYMDYVFLNDNEFNHLAGGKEFNRKKKIDSLGKTVGQSTNNKTIAFIQKGKRKNMVLNFVNGNAYSRTFWHSKLSRISIVNDTGAGDVFAGGVIAGLLSPHLISHQPAPIKLGSILASKRLRRQKFPEKEFALDFTNFVESNLRIENKNYPSQVKAFWEKWGNSIVAFALGILASLIASKIMV
ncbi:MAG: carbohydrate kinase family protein, partial [Bacteroidota bacterium]